MTARIALLLAVAFLSAAGCARRPPDGGAPLPSIDQPGLAQVLEKHRNQVVLVEFWATWCEPCLKLLPHTVALEKRLGDRGLVVITVSLDSTDQESAVRKRLADNGAQNEDFLSIYGVGSDAFTAFGIEDGALPHVRLYDRQGTLRRTFASGGKAIDPTAIEKAVQQLLKADY